MPNIHVYILWLDIITKTACERDCDRVPETVHRISIELYKLGSSAHNHSFQPSPYFARDSVE